MDVIVTAIIVVIAMIITFFITKKINHSTINNSDYENLKSELLIKETKVTEKNEQIEDFKKKITQLEANVSTHQTNATIAKTQLADAKAIEQKYSDEVKKIQETYNETINSMKQQSEKTFENLANKILKENNESFDKHSKRKLEETLTPLKDNIREFKETVSKSFSEHTKEQYSLKNAIKDIVTINESMTSETKNLTDALKGDSKTQGSWGEFQLERLLEISGLKKNIDYILQAKGLGLRNDENKLQKPDVIVHLPEQKNLIIDAKVSLTSYEAFCNESEDIARANHLKNLISSVENHIKNLDKVSYSNNDKLKSPDFVFMFIPIESCYITVVNEKPSLLSNAWDKKIIIVCPTTLLANLKTVASIWRLENQNKNALDIAKQGGLLYDKVCGFVDDIKKLGKGLDAAQEIYGNAFSKLSTGQGNILQKTEKLRDLGVKTQKQLDVKLIEDNTHNERD